MTIPERHVTEENTLQKKSELPTYFPKAPAPKVNRRFTFLHFFFIPSLELKSSVPFANRVAEGFSLGDHKFQQKQSSSISITLFQISKRLCDPILSVKKISKH